MASPDFVICLECETPCYMFEWTDGQLTEALCGACGHGGTGPTAARPVPPPAPAATTTPTNSPPPKSSKSSTAESPAAAPPFPFSPLEHARLARGTDPPVSKT